jgi:N-acetylmuramoyl-L-alanine amidase
MSDRNSRFGVAVVLCIALVVGVGLGIVSFVATRGPALIQTPSLTGLKYGEAASASTTAGFRLRVDPAQDISKVKDVSTEVITKQTPAAGTSVKHGATLTVQLKIEIPPPPQPPKQKHVVTLDPGHSSNSPASEMDPETGLDVADNSGADGEIQTNWDIAVKTKALLEQAGYTVQLTKPAIDAHANLKQRAEVGNSGDIMIRIHYDPALVDAILYPGVGQSKSHGSSTVKVDPQVSAKSAILANALFPYLSKVGIKKVANDMGGSSNNTGDAYVVSVLSHVPVVVIENDPGVVRDNPTGQSQVASAIVQGVNAYFNGL